MDRLVDNFFNVAILAQHWRTILSGFWVTLAVAAAVIVLGIGLGLALAVLRSFQLRPVNWLIVFYVDLFRTLPQLVVLIFLYFGLPYAGLTIGSFAATVIALGCVLSAFAAEAFWAAITAVPAGQWE